MLFWGCLVQVTRIFCQQEAAPSPFSSLCTMRGLAWNLSKVQGPFRSWKVPARVQIPTPPKLPASCGLFINASWAIVFGEWVRHLEEWSGLTNVSAIIRACLPHLAWVMQRPRAEPSLTGFLRVLCKESVELLMWFLWLLGSTLSFPDSPTHPVCTFPDYSLCPKRWLIITLSLSFVCFKFPIKET